jgi:hypothetical protein
MFPLWWQRHKVRWLDVSSVGVRYPHSKVLVFLQFGSVQSWEPGRRPWTMGVLLVRGRATGSGAGRLPRPCGRCGAGKLYGVAAVQWLPR